MSEQARTVAERKIAERVWGVRADSSAPFDCGDILTAYAAEIWEAAAQEIEGLENGDPLCAQLIVDAVHRLRLHTVSRQEQE